MVSLIPRYFENTTILITRQILFRIPVIQVNIVYV